MLRFGMCACGGFIERAALPMIQRLDNMQATAAFDVNAECLQRIADMFDVPRRCGTYEELLAVDDVDVVYIASPNVLHKSQTIAAAAAGKHVFCQKPLALTGPDCKDMIAACKANGVQLGVGFCNRFGGAQQKAVELIKDGAIGEISHMHFSFNLGSYNPETVGWRCDPKLSGGGPLMDLAPHMVDFASYIFEDNVESVTAYVRPDLSETEIELDTVAAMQFSRGARLTMDASFVRGNGCVYTIIGTRGEIHAVGTMVWLVNGEMIGKLTLRAGGKEEELTFPTHEHIGMEMELFCAAVEKGEEPPVSGEAGYRAQAVIDAIYESGRTGRRIDVMY